MDRPSAMQNRRPSNSGCCTSCPWVLVDSISRIGYRRNATSAETLTSRGFTVQVSFELADPPGVSLCFVNCTGAGRNETHLNGPPLILSAAQALVLLVISFTSGPRHKPNTFQFHDYFVYKAGPGRPRLDRIPIPYALYFNPKHVGILPLSDGGASEHYAVVIPTSDYTASDYTHRGRSMKFTLSVFWSESRRWTTKHAPLALQDPETDFLTSLSHDATRVIAVGGGVLGWVDLWHGILLCDVLEENPLMRLVQWPVEPSDEVLDYGCGWNHICPRPFRDVTIVNGLIRFVDMRPVEHAATPGRGWTATVWSRMVSSPDWHQTSTLHTGKDASISVVDDLILVDRIKVLLPAIFDEEAKRLTWHRVMCASPTLSVTNDDVVYIMVPAKLENPIPCLLVFNMRNKALEALEEYHGNMTPLAPTHIGSAFPSYLDTSASM